MPTLRTLLALAILLCPALAAAADRYFTTSDGVQLHYIEAGPNFAPTIVFVPGWTMPAWIFSPQITYFSRDYHVVAFDPRGQGDSAIPPTGYEPGRRGADIRDLIAALGNRQVILVGWSLGVLDALAYVHESGDGKLLAAVLIDNSVGEEPAPTARPSPAPRRPPAAGREAQMARFVRSMFHRPQDETYLDTLTETCLRTPPYAAAALLAYPVPRSYWREAVYAVHKPILYIVRPGLAGQAQNLAAHHPATEADIYTDAGHALFIDDASRFDTEMLTFLHTMLPPP